MRLRENADGGSQRVIPRSSGWHLDHHDHDRSRYIGASHTSCNRSAGAKKGNRRRLAAAAGLRRRELHRRAGIGDIASGIDRVDLDLHLERPDPHQRGERAFGENDLDRHGTTAGYREACTSECGR